MLSSSVLVLTLMAVLIVNVVSTAIKAPIVLKPLKNISEDFCFPAACFGECPETHPVLRMRALISLFCQCCKDELK
ncbi:hypothetical protein L596_013025 [Steinernema carpocapsae]|uniref:Nematode cuticle collagen N-terminal domain-containing protein n=1 Tax=Steinernema carpocapsae TaxID=34508 RepID=A0A4U5NZT8_STECR|nr:hypothetical protein L596_013025 [Steinernema carpocapsae]